jgi:hypothetical protein
MNTSAAPPNQKDNPDEIERPSVRLLYPTEHTKPQRPLGPGALVEAWSDANPWTDDYLERELASMRFLPQTLAYGDAKRHVSLSHRTTIGIIDCYLRQDFLEWGPFAHFQIDGKVWMSITPMEIESQYMPIMLAQGRVGVGGLGLGYAALRIASKPEVSHVTVYETNPMVLHMWERAVACNAPATWVDKIELVHCDVTQLRNQQFDFFFNDVYEKLLDEAAVAHWPLLCRENDLGGYHFWGIECWLLPFVLKRTPLRVPFYLRNTYWPYLKQLFQALEDGHGIIGSSKVGSYPHNLRDIKKYLKGTEVWPE